MRRGNKLSGTISYGKRFKNFFPETDRLTKVSYKAPCRSLKIHTLKNEIASKLEGIRASEKNLKYFTETKLNLYRYSTDVSTILIRHRIK